MLLPKPWSNRILILAFCLALFTQLGMRQLPAPSGGTFFVDSEVSTVLPDGYLSLREAILVSEGFLGCGWSEAEKSLMVGCTWNAGTNCISGGCGAGYFDSILFGEAVNEIKLYDKLPALTDAGTWIDGSKPGGGKVVLSTWPAVFTDNALIEIQGADVTLSNLVLVNGVTSDILVWWNAQRARIAYNHLGVLPGATLCAQPGVERSSMTGVWVRGSPTMPLSNRAYIYGNVIGCHSGDGISADGADNLFIGYQPDAVTADGNWIGTSPGGAWLPNGGHGVHIIGAGSDNIQNNTLGNNTIANNGGAGVAVEALSGSTVIGSFIRYNTIYGNGGLPVDLGSNGPTPNDPGDLDSGPNNYLNYPEITNASGSMVWGTAEPYCKVDIYRAVQDPSQPFGGGIYKGSVNVDSLGSWSVDLSTLPGMSGVTRSGVSLISYCPYSGSSEMSPQPLLFLPLVRK
jgi:hypothetical protein